MSRPGRTSASRICSTTDVRVCCSTDRNSAPNAYYIFGVPVEPSRDDCQILRESDEIGTRARSKCSALFVQSEKLRRCQRGRAKRILQRKLGQPDGVADR